MEEKTHNSDVDITAEDTFNEVFGLYYTRLWFFAARLVPDNHRPEDVLQDAFVKLWNRRSDFDNLYSIKSFLYTTVKNHCLNMHRHEKVVQRFEKRFPDEPTEAGIDHDIIESETLARVHKALQKLPDGCRNVLHLSYFEKMKNKDVAEYLQISINTVKTQKQRGLLLLRSLLKTGVLFISLACHYF